jgi:hypothetical protein
VVAGRVKLTGDPNLCNAVEEICCIAIHFPPHPAHYERPSGMPGLWIWKAYGKDLNQAAAKLQPPVLGGGREGQSGVIYYHGGQAYAMEGGDQIIVPNAMHYALRAFLEWGRALSTEELEKAGVYNVSKTMRAIADKFPGCVRMPQNKGDGYFVRVLPTR